MSASKIYPQAVIYKISSPSTTSHYIGSTSTPLSHRMSRHIYDAKIYDQKQKQFCSSSIILKYDDYTVCVLETFINCSKKSLHEREAYYIKMPNTVNKIISYRPLGEYYEINQDKNRAKANTYYHTHQAEVKTKYQTKTLCSCGLMIMKANTKHIESAKHLKLLAIKNTTPSLL
mgnify:CR=1 FL=1